MASIGDTAASGSNSFAESCDNRADFTACHCRGLFRASPEPMEERSANIQTGPGPQRVSRPRSLPTAGPFRVAVVFYALFCLGLIGAGTALYAFVREPGQAASRILLGSLGFSLLMWLIAFFKRRSAHCPLCKGTPLLNTGARTHARARRVQPLNHGQTAVVSILAAQRFRCMYCGSDFDLLKPPSRALRGVDDQRGSNY